MNEEIRNADPIRSIIIQQYDKMLSDGTIENMVKEAMQKQIENVIRDSFNAYKGKARELIGKKLEEIIIPALEQSDFNRMTTKLSAVINEALEHSNVGVYAGILDGLKYMAGVPKFKNFQKVKLSEIFKEYQRYIGDCGNIYLDKDCCSEEDGAYRKYWDVTCSMVVSWKNVRSALVDRWDVELSCKSNDDALSEHDQEELRFRFSIREGYEKTKRIIIHDLMDLYDLEKLDRFSLYLMQIRNHFCDIEIDDSEMEVDMEIDCEE